MFTNRREYVVFRNDPCASSAVLKILDSHEQSDVYLPTRSCSS